MRIDIVKSGSKLNVLNDIQNKFGSDAIILNRIKDLNNEIIFVCHDKPAENMPAQIPNYMDRVDDLLDKNADVIKSCNDENIFYFYLKNYLDDLPLNKDFKNKLLSFIVTPKSINDLIQQFGTGLEKLYSSPKEFSLDANIYNVFGNSSDKTAILEQLSRQISIFQKKKIKTIKVVNKYIFEINSINNSDSTNTTPINNLDYVFDFDNYVYIVDIADTKDIEELHHPNIFSQNILLLPASSDYAYCMHLFRQKRWDSLILSDLEAPYFSWSIHQFLIQANISPYLATIHGDFTNNLVIVEKNHFKNKICALLQMHFSNFLD